MIKAPYLFGTTEF